MGGKGRRRRENNYRAAHGGNHTRLPPPPDPSQLDAVPSKLKKLFSFRSDDGVPGGSVEKKRKRGGAGVGKLRKSPSKVDGGDFVNDDDIKLRGEDGGVGENKKERKKRKRGQVDDLRFETLEGISKRRERRKRFLEAKKKKKKEKKNSNAEEEEFPGRERIKFGEVVQAPPKLLPVPKAAKKCVHNAYKERMRLEVIDAYRQRRGWTDRPGLKLPSLDLTPAFDA